MRKYKKIKCSKGTAIVDAEDYPLLYRYTWNAYSGKNYPNQLYAATTIHMKNIPMARFILGVYDRRVVVDHMNHNTMDNRKDNLRICLPAENSRNALIQKGRIYKGVYVRSPKSCYVQIKFKRKLIYVGHFKSPKEAAKAYDKKAVELFGQFAYLNFPKVVKK